MTNNQKRNILIGGGIALVSSAISSVATYFIHTNWCYNTLYEYAANLYEDKMYKEALEKFKELDGYKNSDEYARLCKEQIAKRQIEDMIEDGDLKTAYWMYKQVCEDDILSNRTKDIILSKLGILYDKEIDQVFGEDVDTNK